MFSVSPSNAMFSDLTAAAHQQVSFILNYCPIPLIIIVVGDTRREILLHTQAHGGFTIC